MQKTWRASKSKEGMTYQVPKGAIVEIIKCFPKRRVLVKYGGVLILTYQGCLSAMH